MPKTLHRFAFLTGWFLVLLIHSAASWADANLLPPASHLTDPIPKKIAPGDIVVAVEDFVRIPKTQDSSNNLTNDAHARIQYLQPFGHATGQLIINDTRGILYLTDEQGRSPSVYMDLRQTAPDFDDSMFPNEMGLAGVAFHPEFTSLGKPGFGKFYTAYSATSESGAAHYLDDDAASHESVIREWTATDPRSLVFAGTSREVFRVGQFAPNHNVGHIAFNPNAKIGSPDYGVLYITLGDGGVANDPRGYGQSRFEPLSSILRINPLGKSSGAYSIPKDNPFVNTQANDIAPEIWVYGLRHAQHFSWDSRNRLFINDIGQNQVEEVNLGKAGANYGWRLREGRFATAFAVTNGEPGRVYALPHFKDEFTYPIAQYDHDEGHAIGSGYVYEGQAIAELRGKYVFADIVTGRVFYFDSQGLDAQAPAEIKELRLIIHGKEQALMNVSAMQNSYTEGSRVDLRLGIDTLGELYLLTKADGWIRKLVPNSP